MRQCEIQYHADLCFTKFRLTCEAAFRRLDVGIGFLVKKGKNTALIPSDLMMGKIMQHAVYISDILDTTPRIDGLGSNSLPTPYRATMKK